MEVLPTRKSFVSFAAVLALSGCAVGTAFVRPAPDAIQLGRTTYAEVVERVGKPEEEKRARENGRELRQIAYAYVGEAEAPAVPNTVGGREMFFVFSEDIVVAEGFMSSYASDSTDFDDRKVADIVEGKTRCDEVVSMFGRPDVRAIYPAVEKEGETAIGYTFRYLKRPALQFKMFRKGLQVGCDSAGVVTKVSYTEAGDR
jgi:hypothetical protein